MRIDSGGNVLVGKTTTSSSDPGVHIYNPGNYGRINITKTVSGNWYALRFEYSGSIVGSITYDNSSTAYNTSSDYRLKENVTADWDATTRLKQLNPVRFNFIADADTTVDGFLAHEVQTVVPEAITGTHDEVDDEGNPVYQGIDQSKLVPLLVKTIQELEARVAALEAN
jgi:ABC-type transport system substrate-binding protein